MVVAARVLFTLVAECIALRLRALLPRIFRWAEQAGINVIPYNINEFALLAVGTINHKPSDYHQTTPLQLLTADGLHLLHLELDCKYS